MRRRLSIAIITLVTLAAVPVNPPDTISGFTPEHSRQQRTLEQEFDTHLSADRIGDRIKRMSSKPNHLGSAHQRENAEYLKSLFTSWGRSEEHTSELQSRFDLVCRLLLEKKKQQRYTWSISLIEVNEGKYISNGKDWRHSTCQVDKNRK